MTALRLWLARHGETAWNVEHRLQGSTDLGLTPTGVAQAAALSEQLVGRVFDAAWSSDLLRALETARIAWGEPEQDPRLREIDFGLLEGVAWSDLDPTLQAELVRFADFEPPGGESARAFEDRVFDFVASLGGGDHLVFTHGGVVRALGRRCGVERYPRHGELIVLDWHAHLEIALA